MTSGRSHAYPIVVLLTMTAALAMAFFYAPAESVQGDVQKLFYVHVPSAWLMYLAVVVVAGASALVLARPAEAERWDSIAVSSAELGVVFATIVLTTGPVWGHRVWGVAWVWDARLTSTLVLWAIYVGYLVFRGASVPGPRRARLAAVIGLVGAVDIPVIHFSVAWWRTLHPLPTVVRPGRPQLPATMLVTLLVSVVAFTALFGLLLAMRHELERTRSRVEALEEAMQDQARPTVFVEQRGVDA